MSTDARESRENAYTCKACGNVFVTVDVDHGVTPFMTTCHGGKDCHGMATSSFYPRGPKPPEIGEAQWEWYRPESYSGLDPGSADHVRKGGLLLRARTDKPPIYHGDDGDYESVIKPAVERISGTPARPQPGDLDKMASLLEGLNRHKRRKRAAQERGPKQEASE